MILRSLSRHEQTAQAPGPEPASSVFIRSQKQVAAPFAIIFQAEHSKLAGDLTASLSPEVFGDLDPQVIQAAAEHDFGWETSDAHQLGLLGQRNPHPFPDLSVDETLPSWRDSLTHAAAIAPLVDVLVSRHFSLLGAGDPGRHEFVSCENERRKVIEQILPYEPADLQRWTGAVGFCDLLSLYLCSGSQETVEFPFAHPADPAATSAPKTTLSWEDGSPRFSSPVMKPGTRIALTVRKYEGTGSSTTPIDLAWHFPQG